MKYRITITSVLALLAIALQGIYIRNASLQATPLDQMIDVGGSKLHINCSGKFLEDSPTVVMEAGLNASSETWSSIQPEIARFTRVCTYDRAGLGKSDPPSRRPGTSRQIAGDLHALLKKTGIKSPIVLVGHSFGGINVRMYASLYPEDVVGMVLVDSSHEEETAKWLAIIPPEIRREMEKAGGEKLMGGEEIDLPESQRQMKAANWRTDIPLVVLSRGRSSYSPDDYPPQLRSFAPKGEELRLKLQEDLAGRSSKSKHIFAEKSGHMIHHDQPELVIEAIRQVVEATRGKDRKSF
jgi:pimeloyl-ACP methyl ester carboxylesterase